MCLLTFYISMHNLTHKVCHYCFICPTNTFKTKWLFPKHLKHKNQLSSLPFNHNIRPLLHFHTPHTHTHLCLCLYFHFTQQHNSLIWYIFLFLSLWDFWPPPKETLTHNWEVSSIHLHFFSSYTYTICFLLNLPHPVSPFNPLIP